MMIMMIDIDYDVSLLCDSMHVFECTKTARWQCCNANNFKTVTMIK